MLSTRATSPLKLECQLIDGELFGQTRVLEGWFLYAEGGTRKDENNDGKDDSSKAALLPSLSEQLIIPEPRVSALEIGNSRALTA